MNDRVPCGNYEALVTYLYGECESAERDEIAAHLAQCASCTEEIQALQDTRAHLGAWTPPSLPLGFQLTRTEAEQPANVLRPAAWWRRPLPAWAQAAAAAFIFAAGMGVNVVRSSAEPPASVAQQTATPPVIEQASSVDDVGVTRDEFARLEARLRSVEHEDVQRTSLVPRTSGVVDDQELFERLTAFVDARIALSEARQRGVLAGLGRTVDETTQRVDLATQRLEAMEEEFPRQQQAIRTIGSRLAVRTSFQPASGGR
jgi:hypothetical protein